MTYRSRPYLDLSYAEGKTCVRCGALGVEPCHYSGVLGHWLGRGAGVKAADLVADLCRECHRHMDTYADGNDYERAAFFLLYIIKTLLRNIEQGHAEVVVHTVLRDAQQPLPKQRRTTASGKTLPRAGPRFSCVLLANAAINWLVYASTVPF